jgi:hypothetical protein
MHLPVLEVDRRAALENKAGVVEDGLPVADSPLQDMSGVNDAKVMNIPRYSHRRASGSPRWSTFCAAS